MMHWFWAVLLLMLADPFVGTWKLHSADKSQHAGFESYVIKVTPTEHGHKWEYDLAFKGNPKHLKYTIVTDQRTGKVTMYTEDGKVMAEGKLTKKGPTEWDFEAGEHKSHGSISADGKTMTVVTTAPGAATHVFDKQ